MVVVFAILQTCFTKTSTKFEDGRVIIRNGILFESLGRPYELSKYTILKQPIDLSPLLDSIAAHQNLSESLNNICGSTANIFKEGGNTEYTNFINDGTYVLITRATMYPYEAEQVCLKNGMTLPDLNLETDSTHLVQFLLRTGIDDVALSTHFSLKTHRNFMKNSGTPITRKYFPSIHIEGEYDLDSYSDDWNAVYKLNRQGHLVVYNYPVYYYRPHPFSTLRGKVSHKELKEADKNAQTVVICQKKRSSSSTEQVQKTEKSTHLRDRCDASRSLAEQSSERMRRRIQQELASFGLTLHFDKVRSKRVVGTALSLLGKGLLRLPFMAWDLYSDYKQGKEIDHNKERIRENAMHILRNSDRLDNVQIQISALDKEQNMIKQSLRLLEQKVSALQFDVELQQTLLTINDFIGQQEMQIYLALNDLTSILNAVQRETLPSQMLPSIEKYLNEKGIKGDVLFLRKEQPIILDKQIHEAQITLYAIFEEGDLDKVWDLYKLTPVPIFKGKRQLVRQIPYQYALIDKDQTSFSPVTELEAHQCKRGICPHGNEIRSIHNDPCGVRSIISNKDIKNCLAKEEKAMPFFVQTEYGIAYSVPEKLKGRLICDGNKDRSGVDGDVILEAYGIMTIPQGCDLKIESIGLRLQGPLLHSFYNVDELSITEISDIDEISEFLNEAIDVTNERAKLITSPMTSQIKYLKWVGYIVLIVLCTLIVLIAISYGFQSYRFCTRFQRYKKNVLDFKDTMATDMHNTVEQVAHLSGLLRYLQKRMDKEETVVNMEHTYATVEGGNIGHEKTENSQVKTEQKGPPLLPPRTYPMLPKRDFTNVV